MSGRLWEQRHIIRYYLHRWPSQRSMKRARQRIRALTSRSRLDLELEDVTQRPQPVPRGWGNYFRTGNATTKFNSIDRHVVWRLSGCATATCTSRPMLVRSGRRLTLRLPASHPFLERLVAALDRLTRLQPAQA